MPDIRISDAAFRAAWLDPNISRAEVMAQFGMAKSTVWHWAQRLNLPRKRMGRTPVTDHDQLRQLWIAGIGIAEIAGFFGAHENTIFKTVRCLRLPARGRGTRPKMTLAEYRETLLVRAMQRDAAVEQRQMIIAEMADKIGTKVVGAGA